MEQNKVKFTISLPIVAVISLAAATPIMGGEQGTNTWNTNVNHANAASSSPTSTPEAKPKYYVEPLVKNPHAVTPEDVSEAIDNRYAPDNLDELLAMGRNPNATAPTRPAYPQMRLQHQAPAPANLAQQSGLQNSNASPQYGQPYGPNGYGPNFNNGFPGGYNSFPANSYGGFPSMGGFPDFGSPSPNFSPFGFW